jgi:hypothetical protein
MSNTPKSSNNAQALSPSVLANLKKSPRVRDWVDLSPSGEIQIHTGKVEIGQGILHAILCIACEQWNLSLRDAKVNVLAASTARSPDEAVTSGSLSIQDSGATVRQVCAQVRERCITAFALERGVPRETVLCQGGMLHSGEQFAPLVSFMTDTVLNETVSLEPLHANPISPAHRGNTDPELRQRSDLAQKVMGQFVYIQDLVKPQMLWGLVLHPRTLRGQLLAERLEQFEQVALQITGVERVVHDGALVGVLANSEQALSRCNAYLDLHTLWDESQSAIPSVLQNNHGIAAWLRAQPLASQTITQDGVTAHSPTSLASSSPPAEQTKQAPHLQAVSVKASFSRPYVQHASIGLSTAWARWPGEDDPRRLEVISHSQGIYNLRRDLGLAFGLAEQDVEVQHHAGAGCYGHNGADDVAFDAAWLASFAPERWVRVQWRRSDELGLSPMSPAMSVEITATASPSGQLLTWETDIWSQGHGTRPGRESTPALLGAWQVNQNTHAAPVLVAINAPLPSGGGAERNAVPLYNIPQWAVHNHRVLSTPFRVSALRSLGGHVNVFALESVMDMLAQSLHIDPLTFRLNNLSDPRALAVLKEVARLSNWFERLAQHHEDRKDGMDDKDEPYPQGWGLGFARYKNSGAYCAVVAQVLVSESVQVKSLFICADVGHVVHDDGVKNQIEGGAVQAVSLTLLEQAQLGLQGVLSKDWEHYRIARFGETPRMTVSLIDPLHSPSSGAGECSIGPTAGALANAVSQAISARIYNMPLNAENLLHSLES